jgi:nitroreductase
MNGQPWAFVVVRSPDTKRRFSEIKTSGMRRILEKTGLIALAGVLKAIDGGMVEAGSRVLCCLTSGVSSAGGRAQPEVTVRDEKDVVEYSEHVLSEELRVHGASGGILFQDSRVRGPT